MIDKISDVRAAKVHQHGHAGKWSPCVAVPIRDLNHVRELPRDGRRLPRTIHLEVVLRLHKEMDLVHMELMVFEGLVLNRPPFHRSLRSNNRRWIVVIEWLWRLALNGYEERGRRCVLRKEQRASHLDWLADQSPEALLTGIQSGSRR